MSRARTAAFAAVVLLLLLPVWLGGVPPLSDYVNHLARAHVLAHLSESDVYRGAYAPAWGAYPNLAFDLFAIPLTRAMSVEVVGKLFLTLTVLAFSFGCRALGDAALGRESWRATFACFFVTCEPFLLGYANFTFGVGVAMLAVACMLRARAEPGLRWPLAAAALGLLAAVSHAAAIVTLGIATASLGLARLSEGAGVRAAVREVAPVVPGAAYFLQWLAFHADRSADRSWASVGTSARVLATSILPTYEPRADAPVLAALAMAAVGWLVLARPLRIDRSFAIATALSVLAVFVAPADFAGGYEANGRYALGAWLFALFAVRGQALERRRASVLLVIGFLGLASRQLLVTRAWLELGTELEAQRQALRAVRPGEVLANVTFLDPKAPRSARLRELALLHAPALAVIDSEAILPTLYAIKGVQPLAHTRALYDVHRFRAGDSERVDVARLRAEASVAWLCRAPAELRNKLEPATELANAGDCELLRVGQ